MPFNLKDTNPAARFYYPSYSAAIDLPTEQKEWVDLRLCVGKSLQNILDQTQKEFEKFVQPNKANGKINRRAPLQRIAYTDWIDKNSEQLHHELTTDFMISDWQLIDQDGKKIKCNMANKLKLLEIPEFDLFVAASLEALADNKAERGGEQEKNLSGSSKDSTKDQIAKTA